MGASEERNEGSRAPDERLVRAAQTGDRAAFETLYVRYGPIVHGILVARLPLSEVDDLVQEVFFAAFRTLRTLRDPAAFGGWISSIARNRATDFHRRTKPTTELLAEPEARDTSGSRATEVLDVIRGLPDAYRETLVLRLVEGMTGPEIAEKTGLTHGSVRVNLSRGMQYLRTALENGREP